MEEARTDLAFDAHDGILPPRGLLYSILAQAPMIALAWPPAPRPLGIVLGALALGAGAALNIWADSRFKRHDVPVCALGPVPRLIEEGPFRLTRNPMYLGFVLLSLGPVFLTGIAANVFAPAALAMWLHYRFVLPEETWLRDQRGVRYLAYAARVPRWILAGRPAGGRSAAPSR